MKNDLKKLLRKYIDPNIKIEDILNQKIEYKEDIFVAISFSSYTGNELTSIDFLKSVSEKIEMFNPFLINSLIPLPIFSVAKSEIKVGRLNDLLDFVKDFRLIICCGKGMQGAMGSPKYYAYGTIGATMETLIEATFCLDRAYSWISVDIKDEIDGNFLGIINHEVRRQKFITLKNETTNAGVMPTQR